MLLLLGVGLATGVLPGGGGLLLTVLPAGIAAGAIAATLALRRLARGAEARIRRLGAGSRWVRLAPALSATSDGIDEALHQLRRADPLLLVGIVGFLIFDMLVFWASFRAVGASPELALIWMAYLIGQLGNWLPVPGGIGGTELGLVGALVLYGFPALTATAAVLLYRVIELWIPAVPDSDDPAMILMLTAGNASTERVAALAFGAEDYLDKPFHSPELVLRVRALARRKPTSKRRAVRAPGIELAKSHAE
jgi:hypothetical protein